MKRVAFLLLFLLVILPAKLAAQRDLFFVDDTETVSQAAIIDAAQPLLERDACIGVYVMVGGGEGDLLDNLQTDDMLDESGNLKDEAIIIYISIDPDRHEIRYGDKWRPALENFDHPPLPVYLENRNYELAVTSTLSSINFSIVAHEQQDTTWQLYLIVAAAVIGVVFGFARMFYFVMRGILKLGRSVTD